MTDPRDAQTPDDAILLPREDVDRLDRSEPIAVFFVGGEYALEAHSLPAFADTHARNFKQILFVSVGVADQTLMDTGVLGVRKYRESEEAERLLRKTRWALDSCLVWAHHLGLKSDCRVSIAVDEAEEADRIAGEVAAVYPKAQFFVTKLVDPKRSWLHKLFHADMADAIRKRLERKGLSVTVLPVVLPA